MSLQQFLIDQFTRWTPRAPEVVSRTTGAITLVWSLDKFSFLQDKLLFRLEKNNKLPKWIVVYSGGKTTKTIYDLAPSHPHKFRLKVILRNEIIDDLAERALQHFGDEYKVYEEFSKIGDVSAEVDESSVIISEEVNKIGQASAEICDNNVEIGEEMANIGDAIVETGEISVVNTDFGNKFPKIVDKSEFINKIEAVEKDGNKISYNKGDGDGGRILNKYSGIANETYGSVTDKPKWLESQWSEETWTSTETGGTSAVCFCMAVKCGYIKQIQSMLDERPELIGIHSNIGFTPLATAVRKGDISIVRLLLALGAEVEQVSGAGQTPLQLAVLAADADIVDVLLEAGADIKARDWNGLSAEHYAVDACSAAMVRLVLARGGDPHARDNNGWTPLFRALCEGASTDVIAELVARGSDLEAVDKAGLPLAAVARLLKNRHGAPRESVLRLVESTYPHEKARAVFTRLSRKIHNLNQLLNLI